MDYSKFDFPPYVFHEFPKAVTLADGSVVIVQNAEEEAVLKAPVSPPAPPERKTLTLGKE